MNTLLWIHPTFWMYTGSEFFENMHSFYSFLKFCTDPCLVYYELTAKSTTIEGNPQLKSYLIRSTIFFKCHVAFCWESLALWGNFHIRNLETSYKIIRLYIIHLSQYQYPCTMYIFTVTGTKLLPPLSMARYVIYYILQDISSIIKNVISSDPV